MARSRGLGDVYKRQMLLPLRNSQEMFAVSGRLRNSLHVSK
jgi:hypothetical protein